MSKTLTILIISLLVSQTFSSASLYAQSQAPTSSSNRLVLVVGASGEPQFEQEFQSWAQQWQQLAETQEWEWTKIDKPIQVAEDESHAPKQQLRDLLQQDLGTDQRLWIVMLGHGTFASNVAKFNLIGPDVSAQELKDWLAPIQSPVVVINCSSASAPFLTTLAAPNRILVTATKSGAEYNFSRFGKYLAESIRDFSNDLDHDSEVSLLEAFLAASKGTLRFYDENGRLASEHALINDNGDKVGTTADFYRGVLPVKEAKDGQIDGRTASRMILLTSPDAPSFGPALAASRAKLEEQIDQLRRQKSLLPNDEYYDQLEELMLELAAIYDQAEKAQDATGDPSDEQTEQP